MKDSKGTYETVCREEREERNDVIIISKLKKF